MNPDWRPTASRDLLGNGFWILAFEADVRPKFGLEKRGFPPVTAHPGK